MSINIVNNNKSLTKIASNSNLNKRMRTNYVGGRDTLYSGNMTTGLLNFNTPITNYDYIEIEIGRDEYWLYETVVFSIENVLQSTSSTQCAYSTTSSDYFSFYLYNTYSLYFAETNGFYIRRISGVKYSYPTVHITDQLQSKKYSYNSIFTGGAFNSDAIFRKVIDYKLANSLSSFINVYHYLCPDKLINLKAFAIKPNGETYILPYCDENGNITSINLQSSGENFCVMIKGITWEAGTIFRFIVDYIK